MRKTVLGLYLSEETAQAVVLERNALRQTLHAMHEWHNTLFNYAGDDTPGMDEFVEHLSTFLSSSGTPIQQANVSLDMSLLFTEILPVQTASKEQWYEDVEWEINEYFPGLPRHTFVSDIHLLARRPDSRFDTVLAISARRNQIQKLRLGLGKVHLKLDVVDPDHFSTDLALRKNHPEIATGLTALIGIKESRIDISLMRNNELESFVYHTINSREQAIDRIATLSHRTSGLSVLMIFGPDLDDLLAAEIKKSSAVPVETLNPLRNMDIAPTAGTTLDPTTSAYRFAAALGVALRDN